MTDVTANEENRDWFEVRKLPVRVEAAGPYDDPSVVETIEGDFSVDDEYIEEHDGYFLIRGIEGEIYPCGVDIFEDSYEVIEEE